MSSVQSSSQLISDSHPTIVQVIPPSEDLQVVTIRHKVFYNFIYLFRLLRLSSPLTEDNVAVDSVANKILEVTLVADEAGFFCML